MKPKSLFAGLLLLGALSFTSISCDNDDAAEDDVLEETSAEGAGHVGNDGKEVQIIGPEGPQVAGYTDQMDKVWKEYADLRNELYDADVDGAKKEAQELADNLKLQDDNATDTQSWTAWATSLQNHLTPIMNAADVDAMRNQFDQLSAEMRKGVMTFGLNEDVYWQYCPMAKNDQGAYWLSEERKIRNPYFGDKMKTCGETKGMLQKRES